MSKRMGMRMGTGIGKRMRKGMGTKTRMKNFQFPMSNIQIGR
jgi:hypothetical protein